MRGIILVVTAVSIVAACGGSSDDADRFCEILVELDELDTQDLPPAETLAILEQERDKFVEGTKVAPEEINADANLFADGVVRLLDLQIEAGGDVSRIDQTAADALAVEVFTAEFDAAGARVSNWRELNCD